MRNLILKDQFTINSQLNSSWGLPTTEMSVAIVQPTDLCFLSSKEHVEYLCSFRVTNSAVPVGIDCSLRQTEKRGKNIGQFVF